MWRCEFCGEDNEDNFECCWNCISVKDGSSSQDSLAFDISENEMVAVSPYSSQLPHDTSMGIPLHSVHPHLSENIKGDATNKYQINAFVALLIGLVGFIACAVTPLFLFGLVLPKSEASYNAAKVVGLFLVISFFGFMKSKTTIVPRSEQSLRTITIIISIITIFVVLAWAIYAYLSGTLFS